MATNPLLAQRLQQMGRTALAKSAPAPLLRLLGGVGNVNFTPDTGGSVAGFSGKAAPGAFAGVNVGDPNTIQVMDQAGFAKPGQTGQLAVHEATHIMQNNLPPKVAANIPADNPTDPYNFGGEQGLVAARKAGQTLLDKPREQQAAIMQYYTAQNEGYQNKLAAGTATPADHQAAQQREQVYGPWVNDLNHAPQSVIMPTDPNAQGNTINTKVRPVAGPATDIPGATMYATQTYQYGQKPGGDIFDQVAAGQSQPAAGDIFDQVASDPNAPPAVNSSVPIPAGLQKNAPPSMSERLASAVKNVGVPGIASGNTIAGGVGMAAGAVKGLGQTLWNTSVFQPIATMQNKSAAPAAAPFDTQARGTAQTIGKGAEQAAEFLVPGGAEEDAVNAITKIAPKAAPFAKIGTAALSSGAVNKAQGGSFSAGAAGGAVGSGVGQLAAAAAPGLKAAGGKLVNSAAGLIKSDTRFGAKPGLAYLEGGGGPALSMGHLASQASRINDRTGSAIGAALDNAPSDVKIQPSDVLQRMLQPVDEVKALQTGPGGTGFSPQIKAYEDNLFPTMAAAEDRGGFTPRELFDQVKRPIAKQTKFNLNDDPNLNTIRQDNVRGVGDLLKTAVPEIGKLNPVYQGSGILADRAAERAATGSSPLSNLFSPKHVVAAGLSGVAGSVTHNPFMAAVPVAADALFNSVPGKTAVGYGLFKGGQLASSKAAAPAVRFATGAITGRKRLTN